MANVILPNRKTVKVIVKENITIISEQRESQKDELVRKCTAQGMRVVVEKNSHNITMIGFMFKEKQSQNMVHWVEFYESEFSLYESLSFHHTYNMNTGASKKSFNQSYNVRQRLQKATGFNNWYSRQERI